MEQVERPYKYRLAFNQSLTNGAIAFEGSIHWDPSTKTDTRVVKDRIEALTHLEQMLADAQGMFDRAGHLVVGSKNAQILNIIKEYGKHGKPDLLMSQLEETLKGKSK
jgi:3-deoxy-D-arabino-heptulosonate 7-phosphate (DAHP) synthase